MIGQNIFVNQHYYWHNIALFTLLRYRQVLPTKGLSPLPMPHSDENCYNIFSWYRQRIYP
ncbi:unknown protein [Microcystis aeruginosa NIES-843]|uniref:Uncharacterized protein n=1 Tax=Microcystis aeruginosa (strain NIES-843 / IAM M-2473) TaxID=449447 RepID=B0JN54_MICAN|nr:unknown protein [Microcystis aeruginosa NIES-843]